MVRMPKGDKGYAKTYKDAKNNASNEANRKTHDSVNVAVKEK